MIDNTHVVLQGTGRNMVPVPEMASFAERYGFQFQAHEKGDVNRSARVERPIHYIENNFLAGRSFQDWDDAYRQARAWCDKLNAEYRGKLKACPRELFATERAYLKALPIWVPPVYRLHQRLVDMAGYVSINNNRYSVPEKFLGLQVEARETKDSIEIYRGPRLITCHRRVLDLKIDAGSVTKRIGKSAQHHNKRGSIESNRESIVGSVLWNDISGCRRLGSAGRHND